MTTPNDGDSSKPEFPRASANTPWVGAHVACTTLFCSCAALITHELSESDDGEDDQSRSTRLDWLPDYDEPLINQALERLWNDTFWLLKYGLWWSILCIVVFVLYDPTLGIVLAAPLLAFAPWLWRQAKQILVLEQRRRAALRCTDKLKLADLGHKEQVVNWWALRRAMMSVTKPQEGLSDPTLRLAGKPFLILQHGSLLIPVVRKHRGKHELRSQNRARIAAYCHLIETVERGQAPFGIFMFAGSYEVHIVPNSQSNKRLLSRGLEQARRVLEEEKAGRLPEAPDASCCRDCPFGKPRVRRLGVTDKHLGVIKGAYTPRKGADGRMYHSVCGDRFEWCPPHRRAQEKGLPE
jgi:hypothetical protein